MTANQKNAFERAEAKLPDGFSYNLRDEGDNRETVPVYGVELRRGDEWVAYADKTGKGWYTPGPDQDLQKSALNRACAALWHVQPVWE